MGTIKDEATSYKAKSSVSNISELKEIEYWKNLIEKIGKKWDYSFESEALAKAKGYLKGLEEARDIYDKEMKRAKEIRK